MNSEFLNESLFVSAIGILIVFASLFIIFLIFLFIPKILKLRIKKTMQKQNIDHTDLNDISSETIAVISTALHLYLNTKHDDESNAMTIKTISRRYSPWSSKIYVMSNLNKPYF